MSKGTSSSTTLKPTEMFHTKCQRECHTAPHSDSHWNVSHCQREGQTAPHSLPLKHFTLRVKGNVKGHHIFRLSLKHVKRSVRQHHIHSHWNISHSESKGMSNDITFRLSLKHVKRSVRQHHIHSHWNMSKEVSDSTTFRFSLKHVKRSVRQHHIQTLTETCQKKCQTAPHSESHWNSSPIITVKCQTALRSFFLLHCTVGIPVAWATFHHWWYV